ncbi:site-specific integrase [Novosphingobium sp. 9U]|uniref:site-specific integrase n=1 Tax=Novosphingobium sp. 9U TaxID=2653158 RepID=UPI0012F1AF27|nr:site-specific integrase [Novosphingobium sp. 9U]VWX50799.1 Integrase [Novosphingobium sp. 9U]
METINSTGRPLATCGDDVPKVCGVEELLWAIAKVNAGTRITLDPQLIAAFQAGASPHSLRALRCDLEAFDQWCRDNNRTALPASPVTVADYLDARAEQGGKPASLGRYKASIAKLHRLLDVPDPTTASLVKHRLAAVRHSQGTAQAQARPLRFKGAVNDVSRDMARGLNLRALLKSCGEDLPGLRNCALLSVAYDTGLRASELVAVAVEDIVEAIDPEVRLLRVSRSKGDLEGEGATAFLSPRSVRAIGAWLVAAQIESGPIFRRVKVRRFKARGAATSLPTQSVSGLAPQNRRKTIIEPAISAWVECDVGERALHPGSIGPLYRKMIQEAFARGALPDLTADDLTQLLRGISAHSTRVGLNQDLFASGEGVAGIMDALRLRSPRMALEYNRNLAAEQGAAGRLMGKFS